MLGCTLSRLRAYGIDSINLSLEWDVFCTSSICVGGMVKALEKCNVVMVVDDGTFCFVESYGNNVAFSMRVCSVVETRSSA